MADDQRLPEPELLDAHLGRRPLGQETQEPRDRTDREPHVAALDQTRSDAAPYQLACPTIEIPTHHSPGPRPAPSDATDLEHRSPPAAASAAEQVDGRHRDHSGCHHARRSPEGRRRSPRTGRYCRARAASAPRPTASRVPGLQSPAATVGPGGSSSPCLRSLHRPTLVSPRPCRESAGARTRSRPRRPGRGSPVIGYGTQDHVPAKAVPVSVCSTRSTPSSSRTVPMPSKVAAAHPNSNVRPMVRMGVTVSWITYRRRRPNSSAPSSRGSGVLAVTFSRHETAGYRAGRPAASQLQ